jgi:uncharacterized protein (TIGR00255 family)
MSKSSGHGVRSMTGQGHASQQSEIGTFSAEVRTVNNRGFKCVLRTSDALTSMESRIESLVRKLIRRGSIYLTVSWHRPAGEGMPKVDTDVLHAYYRQLEQSQREIGGNAVIDLSSLMTLPGVIVSARERQDDDGPVWNSVQQTILSTIDNLNDMRAAEGANMSATLREECGQVQGRITAIADLAPRTVDSYRSRLESKIQRALAENEMKVEPVDLLREVQIYADRADISEEVTRLASHLEMFLDVLSGSAGADRQPEPAGRKLDFIIQEMFRETNTIGSKAADAEISGHVVEIKCAIERMRELVQNLE